ncbi:MAG: patatin-like phospholipase family protein [Bacteroidales bacterium]|nr:patatin-like phospholipase family protein [Bacteroidales bacterium]
MKKIEMDFKMIVLMFLISVFSIGNVEAQSVKNAGAKRPKVGVVLCGGGAKGFAQIRILKAIDEAGIPVDYIGGTSIGSIIGSLYAVGYDPDVIEELVRKQDWNSIIYDKIPPEFIPIDKKIETRKYLATFPISNGKIKVKSSLVDGVYVNMLLSRLMLPADMTHDYRKLPVPFYCIATDVEHARQYEMTKGNLARSVRASMSIPFLFRPVSLDGKLLIDGGMVNNFPVRNMKERGVDIIIGIDLEDESIPASKIDNSLELLISLMNLSSLEESMYARKHCNIYIKPDLHGRNMLSFNDFDSIIQFGQEAADRFMPEFRKLADSLHKIKSFEVKRPHVQPVDTLIIKEIQVEGVSDNHKDVVVREFGSSFPKKMSIDQIEDVIIKLRASGYYENLWYNIEKKGDGCVFKLHCDEIEDMSLAVAIHYDNNYGIGALVNMTIKNVFKNINRSTLSFDLNIAENPYLKVKFNKHHRKMFRFGVDFSVYSLTMRQYDDSQITNSYSIQDNKLDLYMTLVPNLKNQIRLGAVGDLVHMKDFVGNNGISSNYNLYSYMYLNYHYENLDAPTFARRGWSIDMLGKMVFFEGAADNVTMSGLSNQGMQSSFIAHVDILKTIPIGSKNAIKFELEGGMKIGEAETPLFYQFFVGGQSRMKYFDNILAFTGLNFTDRMVDHIAVNKIAWQWNFYKSLYSTLHVDYGYMNDTYDTWFDPNSFVMGCGLSLGADTVIGPVEISLMGSNINSSLVGFINFGYWF